ncbi:unnamed protein product [Symbiodinium pilosum]|uniref:PDZ domain-containing protein n=1 Tax=Symbiodinium pilosum TaxID=2952 RepID=A0A812SHY5_SYMPI|nr:unnamed protein product [Symbiodinium pilosum]
MLCGACCAGDSELVVQNDNGSKIAMTPMVAAMSAGPGDERFVMTLKGVDALKTLDLDLSDNKCVIFANCDGAVAEWNKHSLTQVFPFDRIIEINGQPCVATDLVEKSKSEDVGTVNLTIEKPQKRLLYLQKPGRLGMDLTYTKTRKGSVKPWITSISEGLVAQWNTNMPELSVGPHDRIITVNGSGGTPSDLVQLLSSSEETLQLEVLHYNI